MPTQQSNHPVNNPIALHFPASDDADHVVDSNDKSGAEQVKLTAADKVKMVPIHRLVPNSWNPNQMTEKQFNELCHEVRRHGEIAKPIVARPLDDGMLEIVDGEHNCRAAKAEGLTNVPCVIAELSDLEAMTQTYKRNQGGTHCPLREGLMYERMMREAGATSRRRLARAANFSEKTIRNKLKYVEALKLRKGSAEEDVCSYSKDDPDCHLIGQLSLDNLETYMDLPYNFRDRWLDAGANSAMLKESFLIDAETILTGKQIVRELAIYGLVDLVDCDRWLFRLKELARFALWCSSMFLDQAGKYAYPVAEHRMPVGILDALPYEPVGDGSFRSMLSPDEWTAIVTSAANISKNADYRRKLVVDGVQDALRVAEKDPAAALTEKQLRMLSALDDAPEFIREAEQLSVEEKYKLHTTDTGNLDVKQAVVEEFTRRRSDGCQPELDGGSVVEVYCNARRKNDQEERDGDEDMIMMDHDHLIDRIVQKFNHKDPLKQGKIDGRPAKEVLVDHLKELKPGVLAMLGSAVLFPLSSGGPDNRWFMASGGSYIID